MKTVGIRPRVLRSRNMVLSPVRNSQLALHCNPLLTHLVTHDLEWTEQSYISFGSLEFKMFQVDLGAMVWKRSDFDSSFGLSIEGNTAHKPSILRCRLSAPNSMQRHGIVGRSDRHRTCVSLVKLARLVPLTFWHYSAEGRLRSVLALNRPKLQSLMSDLDLKLVTSGVLVELPIPKELRIDFASSTSGWSTPSRRRSIHPL